MATPGNIIKNDFSGTSSVFSAVPIVNNAAALVFYLEKNQAKKLTSIAYSLARNPFLAAGGYESQLDAEATLNNEVFGRLTVFRHFTQDPQNLFEPYFDSAFTTVGPPASDFWGPRINYAQDDIVLDLLITKINSKIIPMPQDVFNASDKLTIVLSPFYRAFPLGGTPKIFGEYMGDELARTLSVNGCFAYGSLGIT